MLSNTPLVQIVRVLENYDEFPMKTQEKLPYPDALIGWLNGELIPHGSLLGKSTKASRERVLALVKAINHADELLRGPTDYERDYRDNPPKPVARAVKEIRDKLSLYPHTPYVAILWRYGKHELGFTRFLGGEAPKGERVAVSQLLNLAETKRLPLLRQCACHRWFFAKRADQKACTPNCRHRAYEQTEAFKAKRREYMREYYALKNSGKVK
jgi:hypothetical protein